MKFHIGERVEYRINELIHADDWNTGIILDHAWMFTTHTQRYRIKSSITGETIHRYEKSIRHVMADNFDEIVDEMVSL